MTDPRRIFTKPLAPLWLRWGRKIVGFGVIALSAAFYLYVLIWGVTKLLA